MIFSAESFLLIISAKAAGLPIRVVAGRRDGTAYELQAGAEEVMESF